MDSETENATNKEFPTKENLVEEYKKEEKIDQDHKGSLIHENNGAEVEKDTVTKKDVSFDSKEGVEADAEAEDNEGEEKHTVSISDIKKENDGEVEGDKEEKEDVIPILDEDAAVSNNSKIKEQKHTISISDIKKENDGEVEDDKEEKEDIIPIIDEDAAVSNNSKIKEQKLTSVQTVSSRLEYLSRPKKDILDNFGDERLALPENACPSWQELPLPTKIPFGDCPIPVTKRKLGTNLFLQAPANDFDLADENNLRLPSAFYENMHDPNLKDYFENDHVSEHLRKEGFITKSGKTTCSLRDINRYRVYQRRILAAEKQKHLRDKDEEIRRERAMVMEKKIKKDMQRYHERKTQGSMRHWIKNAIISIKDSSMEKQMERDRNVLNSQIRRQKGQKKRIDAVDEKYKKIFEDHMKYKYGTDEKEKRKAHLDSAKEDLNRLEKLHEAQKKVKLERKEKLDEFWTQKSQWQKEWLERGKELERRWREEKEKNIVILKRTGRLPVLFLKDREKALEKVSRPTKKYGKFDIKRSAESSEQKKTETEGEKMKPLTDREMDTSLSKEKEKRDNLGHFETKPVLEVTQPEIDFDVDPDITYKGEIKDTTSESSIIFSKEDEGDELNTKEFAGKEEITDLKTNKEIDTSSFEPKETTNNKESVEEKYEENLMKPETDIDEDTISYETDMKDTFSDSSLKSSDPKEDEKYTVIDSKEKNITIEAKTNKERNSGLVMNTDSKDKVENLEEKSEIKMTRSESDIHEPKDDDTFTATDSEEKDIIIEDGTDEEKNSGVVIKKESIGNIENLEAMSEEKMTRSESDIHEPKDDDKFTATDSEEKDIIIEDETDEEKNSGVVIKKESIGNIENLEAMSEEKMTRSESNINESSTSSDETAIKQTVSDSSSENSKPDEDSF